MKVKVLQPFSYKGKKLKADDEVVLSKSAFDLYSNVDFVQEIVADEASTSDVEKQGKEAPAKETAVRKRTAPGKEA